MTTEYGVRWRAKDGREYVAAGYDRQGAVVAARFYSTKGYEPRAVEAMCREVGEWSPVLSGEGNEK